MKNEKYEKAEEYKENINEFNENLKSIVEKYWKFNANIEYKTEKQVVNLQASNAKKYVLLRCPTQNNNKVYSNFEYGIEKEYKNRLTFLEYQLLEHVGEQRNILGNMPMIYPFENFNPNLADLIFGMIHIQYFFEKRLGSKKSELLVKNLENKILVLRKEDFKSSFNLENISRHYPYKYEVVSNEEFVNKVVSNEKNRVYYYGIYIFDMDELDNVAYIPGYKIEQKIGFTTLERLSRPRFWK